MCSSYNFRFCLINRSVYCCSSKSRKFWNQEWIDQKEQLWKGWKMRRFGVVTNASKRVCSFWTLTWTQISAQLYYFIKTRKEKNWKTLELVAGCKQAFRSQQRERRAHSKFYLREKHHRSKEWEKKLNKGRRFSLLDLKFWLYGFFFFFQF